MTKFLTIVFFLGPCVFVSGQDLNQMILETITRMPDGGTFARYQKSNPGRQFDDLYTTVEDLNSAIETGPLAKKLKVDPEKAGRFSFCSSATYLLFTEVLENLQRNGNLKIAASVNKELAEVGDKTSVIKGKLDGIGIFGHWNADGPGTAILFHRLGLGTNFSSFEKARPGDFLKIFWNKNIGKGESGHLVVYLGTSDDGKQIQVWSSNLKNSNNSSGYGTMWVDKSRIKRALFSRFEAPQNLNRWQFFSENEKSSDYLIRIRQTGSTGSEMKKMTGAID